MYDPVIINQIYYETSHIGARQGTVAWKASLLRISITVRTTADPARMEGV